MKKVIFVILVVMLAGCGPIKTQQAKVGLEEAKNYCNNLFADIKFDPLRDKIPLTWDGKPTFDMLANLNKASESEKLIIREVAIKKVDCDMQVKKVAVKFGDPGVITIVDSYHGIMNGLLAQLYNEQLSYGEFSKQYYQAINDGDMAIQNVSAQNAAAAQQAYQSYQINQQTYN